MKQGLILIAHEESDFVLPARALLEAQGWRVEICADGQEALTRIEQFSPRLMIVSLSAPTINHFELIRNVHASGMPITILLAAKDETQEGVSQGLQAGAYDLVPPPTNGAVFLAAIKRAVERQDLLDELASLRKALEGENGAIVGMSEQGVKLEAVERELLMRALAKFQGNQTRAAKYLDITRRTLIYRMEKHKLRVDAGRSAAVKQAS